MSRRRRAGRRPEGPPGALWEPVYPTLDLHGETADDARRRAEAWLEAQRANGEPVVRVVTGRGRHSIGPPVLPAEIEDLLRSLRGSVVDEYVTERGGGAFRVELRRKERRPATPRQAIGRGNEALLRRAEERLAELGIAAHPSLIAAEIRRMREEEG